MRFKKLCPSVDWLKERYSYDSVSGILSHNNPRSPKVKSGDPVYCVTSENGYKRLVIEVDGKRNVFQLHRIVWKIHTGEELGQQELDHIDGDKTNNSISNLRIATPSQNQYNRPYAKGYKRSTHKKGKPCSSGGYEVLLTVDGIRKYFGTFTCPLIARVEYECLKRQVAKEFSPV